VSKKKIIGVCLLVFLLACLLVWQFGEFSKSDDERPNPATITGVKFPNM